MNGPRLTSVRLQLGSGADMEVAVQPDGHLVSGRALRLRTGAMNLELPDAEVVKLMRLLSSHYAVPASDGAVESRVTRLSLEILLEGRAAEGGRRVAEATRLVGLALGRIEDGEARGFVSDEVGERRVKWELRVRGRGRGAKESA